MKKFLTEKQLSSLLQSAMDATNTSNIKAAIESIYNSDLPELTTSQKVQFGTYAIEQAMKYKNTHSMNRTILIAAIIQLIE